MAKINETVSLSTFGDLRRRDYRILAYCLRCGRQKRLDLERLIDRFGSLHPYTDSQWRMRMLCTGCKRRGIEIRISCNLDHVTGSGAVRESAARQPLSTSRQGSNSDISS